MSINTVPHLNFRGRAREALTFYQGVFGGETVTVTYQDARAVQHEDDADLVMWGQTRAPGGFAVMAYDVPTKMSFDPGERSFFVSVRGDDNAEIERFWQGLSDGATVVTELGPSGWAPLYGMLTDKFGVTWVLDVAVPYDPS